ncbi:MAG: RluA family pseudouridine synthase [Mariprofundales bacterium]
MHICVTEEQKGQRLDQMLAVTCQLSRGRVQDLIRNGLVLCNGKAIVKTSSKVQVGWQCIVQIPAVEPLNLEAEDIPLDVLFEDEDLLVVNKAAGMVVHPSIGHQSGTLVHALLHHCPNLPGLNGVQRPGIVHRLDKHTSGALVVAKSEKAQHGLSTLFAEHDLQRQYLGWCRGSIMWGNKCIDLPIGRHAQQRKKMCVRHDGREAITEAQLEARFVHRMSRLRLTLQTGRTHQIRVHLAHERLPLLGEPVYARNFSTPHSWSQALRNAIAALPGQALHAEVLGFSHPITDEYIHCVAPLPSHLAVLDSALLAETEGV